MSDSSPNSTHPTTPDPQLEPYLDGLLDSAARAEFERKMAANPAILAQVQLQRRIDASLAGQYAYAPTPENLEIPAPAPLSIAANSGSRLMASGSNFRLRAMVGLAAAMLLACVYIYWPRSEFKFLPPQQIYDTLVRNDWIPDFKCKTDDEFVTKVRERLGNSVLIPMNTLGVTLDGWGYASDYEGTPLGPRVMYLLTHVDGARVLVLMDKQENDRKLTLPRDSKLHIFPRKVGGLILYEITPLDQPKAITAATVCKKQAAIPGRFTGERARS